MTQTIEIGTTLINKLTQEEDTVRAINGAEYKIRHAGGDISFVNMAYIRANYDIYAGMDTVIVEPLNVEEEEEF